MVSCANAFKGTSHFLFYEVQCDWLYVEVFDPLDLSFGVGGPSVDVLLLLINE